MNSMSLIEKQLQKIKQENHLGIMTHVVIGYPSLEESKKLIRLMERLGVDFVELQIPFSDPMADGPTIMKANKHALDNSTKIKDTFAVMKEMSKEVSIPLLFMGYFNTLLNYGTEKFCRDAAKAGCSGLIFPDIPLEEESEEHYIKYAKKYHLHHIRTLSPASTSERMQKNMNVASGFVYFVGRKGITGAQAKLDKILMVNLKKIKKQAKIAVAVGFGISRVEHIKALRGETEVVVIGSAVLDTYKKAESGMGLRAVEKFLKPLIAAAKSVKRHC